MNFEIYENYIEDLYDEEVRNMAGMNPYNLAPWNIGWYLRYINREFRNRYYQPRRYQNPHWTISRRNTRNIYTPADWIPLHIIARNYQNFLRAMKIVVERQKEKTDFLMKLCDEYKAKHVKDMDDLKNDRSAYVDLLINDTKVLMQKFSQFDKAY